MTDQPQSQIFGVSIRGWIAFTLVASICGLNAFSITIDETLKHAGNCFRRKRKKIDPNHDSW